MIFDGVGWRVILFILGVGASSFLVNTLLRRIFGVERKPFFAKSEEYEGQKKWDRILGGMSALVAFSVPLLIHEYGNSTLYLLLISAAIGIVQLCIRASFEKKYAENENDYLYTLMESLTTIIIVITFGLSLFPDFLAYAFGI